MRTTSRAGVRNQKAHWYWYRSLTQADSEYSTTQRELLAVVWDFLIIFYYLERSSFTVRTEFECIQVQHGANHNTKSRRQYKNTFFIGRGPARISLRPHSASYRDKDRSQKHRPLERIISLRINGVTACEYTPEFH